MTVENDAGPEFDEDGLKAKQAAASSSQVGSDQLKASEVTGLDQFGLIDTHRAPYYCF